MSPLLHPSLVESTFQSKLINKSIRGAGIVHIGLGNFHRAHFAVYTAKAVAKSGGDWGISAYSFRNYELVEKLKAQGNLYSVIEIGPDAESAYIPNVHSEFIAGYEKANYVSELIANHNTKIISLTVTEAGYLIDSATGGLNWANVDLINDAKGNSPKTIYGLIINGLMQRTGKPISVMSCDNISHNGDLVRKLLIEYATKVAPEIVNYLETAVSFPNSMVDRIVPGTEEKHLQIAKERIGFEDLAPVPCEKFSMWALEDNFIAGRPEWTDVIFTDQVNEFEQMKLMLLNGSHSLLAYLGGLLNCQTIPDCRFEPSIEAILRETLKTEFLPAVNMPNGINSDGYIFDLFNRWSNTILGDKTFRVGTDGSTKLPQRITKPALLKLNAGQEPKFMAFIVAAWMACMAPLKGESLNEVCLGMKDPNKEQLLSLNNASAEEFVSDFFAKTKIFNNELIQSEIFKKQVLKYRKSIYEVGVKDAIDLALLSS